MGRPVRRVGFLGRSVEDTPGLAGQGRKHLFGGGDQLAQLAFHRLAQEDCGNGLVAVGRIGQIAAFGCPCLVVLPEPEARGVFGGPESHPLTLPEAGMLAAFREGVEKPLHGVGPVLRRLMLPVLICILLRVLLHVPAFPGKGRVIPSLLDGGMQGLEDLPWLERPPLHGVLGFRACEQQAAEQASAVGGSRPFGIGWRSVLRGFALGGRELPLQAEVARPSLGPASVGPAHGTSFQNRVSQATFPEHLPQPGLPRLVRLPCPPHPTLVPGFIGRAVLGWDQKRLDVLKLQGIVAMATHSVGQRLDAKIKRPDLQRVHASASNVSHSGQNPVEGNSGLRAKPYQKYGPLALAGSQGGVAVGGPSFPPQSMGEAAWPTGLRSWTAVAWANQGSSFSAQPFRSMRPHRFPTPCDTVPRPRFPRQRDHAALASARLRLTAARHAGGGSGLPIRSTVTGPLLAAAPSGRVGGLRYLGLVRVRASGPMRPAPQAPLGGGAFSARNGHAPRTRRNHGGIRGSWLVSARFREG